MFSEVFGSGYGIGQTLFKTTPLIIAGCALAICFHAKLFNIGGEGQINAGAFVTAVTVVSLSSLPFIIAFPLSLIAGFAASAFFGFIPAILKIKKGVSEVITTIMLNFIAFSFVNYFLMDFFAVKDTVRTVKIPDNFFIPRMSEFFPVFTGSPFNLTFFFAIGLAVCLFCFIYRTSWGYRLRSIGMNPTASKYMSVNVNKYILLAFVFGAGIMSFAGINFVFGYKGFYEFGFSSHLGFTAIAVALLAKNNPVGIIFTAFLFGFLDFGGLAVNEYIPKEIMLVFQGMVILILLAVNKLSEKYMEGKK
jgi:ABC-type uncharacterized transport system permease subunit